MNVIELLKADHDQVEKLFDEMDNLENFFEKQEIFQKIKRELDLHAYLEETHFYPLLESKPGFEELIDQSLDDHQEIKGLIEELDGIEDEEEFEERLGELIEAVQSHVELEEDELFPRLGTAFSEEEINQLGYTIEESKKSSEAA